MALDNLNFDPPSPDEEQATMRGILSHLAPKKEDDVRMVAAALKTHGPKFEEIFYEWATPFGRYKAKGLWVKVKADPDAMTEVIERQISALSKKQRFSPLPVEALEAMSPQQWRIKGVIPIEGLAVVYGASTAGKSFLSLEMAASVGAGLPFFEHVTKPAAVLYVGLEGEGGYRGRVVAWQRHHGRAMPEGVRFLLQPFRLTDPQDVTDLAAVCPPGCVVFIDTLNRAAPGMDENSSRDMGAVIEGAKTLQRLIGGLVVLIAHSGKDSARGLRGHSSLFAALDAAVLVNRDDNARSWKVDKAKDGKDGETHYFRLNVVEIGIDEDGDAITSCVVVPEEAPTSPGAKLLNAIQKLAMESFREACRINGSVDSAGNFLGINREAWRPVFYRLHVESPSDEARRKAFERVRKELVERGELVEENNVYRLGGLAGKLAEACIAKVIQKAGQPDRHRTQPDMSGAATTTTDRTAAL
ncbi:MAG: AAA family ATPase [Sideroxyarcus sp.]